MSEFDKWWEENCMILSSDRTKAEDIYNLGVESQQAKINELQEQLRIEMERGTEYFTDFHSAIAERDELQARVDKITSHVDINFDEDRDDDQHSYWSGYNQAMRELNDILKGNKDETGIN